MSSEQNITAFIYDKRGRLLSAAKNSYIKTHPLQAKLAKEVSLPDKQFLHAEVAALVRLKDWKKAHSIFITRIGKNGEPLLAKPCPVCARAIQLAGIKNISFTTSS